MSADPDSVKPGPGLADIEAQLAIDCDNHIRDLLHEQMDAQRPSAGKTLEEFLNPSGEP